MLLAPNSQEGEAGTARERLVEAISGSESPPGIGRELQVAATADGRRLKLINMLSKQNHLSLAISVSRRCKARD